MNPNIDSSPGMPLPEPIPVNPNRGGEQNAPLEARPEGAAAAESRAQQSAPPSLSAPVDPSPAQSVTPQDDNSAAPQVAGPASADDGDTIEKEWVIKAKQIVQATQSDPYQQNRQLAAFKADYLKKRYNKIVKLSE